MTKLQASQLDYTIAGALRLVNLATGAANNTTVTSQLTTLLSTAGRGGVSVPLQPSSGNGIGFYTASPFNRCEVNLTSSGAKISDGNGNEVYARLTEATGVYSLRYFSMVNGVETAYAFGATTNIDVILAYVFDWSVLPTNGFISLPSIMVADDISGGGGLQVVESLAPTANNTLPNLSFSPINPNNVILVVNGQTLFPIGASPDFSVGGSGNRAITWNTANTFQLLTTFRVVAIYDRLV